MKPRRGAFVVGLVIGLLLGLVIALGVALYITKTPVPFIDKVPGRSAQQDDAEAERNKNWDPNAPLGSKVPPRSQPGASAAAAGASEAAPSAVPSAVPSAAPSAAPHEAREARNPGAILSGAPVPAPAPAPAPLAARSTAPAADPFLYFVQAGAFTRNEDAEQQKARLALMGQGARITEREQSGRMVYRVRIGPLPSRDEADALQGRLHDGGIEAQIVRVEKP